MSGNQPHDDASTRARRRLRFGRQHWWETAPADRDAHDWLYAAASRLIDDGDERAATRVMDFADDVVARHVR